jgi:hypothetical protein
MTFNQIIQDLPHHFFHKLQDLKTMRERPDFHPEPSAFHHIDIVTSRAIAIGDKDLIMAAIFHDIHKKDTMQINPKTGWPTSPGHDKCAFKTIMNDSSVRDFISSHDADPDTVATICGEHMRIHQFDNMRPAKQQTMRNIPCFDKILAFGQIDDMLTPDADAIAKAIQIINYSNKTVQ